MKRTYAALLALVLLSPVAPLAARADDAASLLAKHKAFAGFVFGDGAIKALQTDEAVTTDSDGATLRTVRNARLGILFRTDTADVRSQRNTSQGFTGNILWRSDENGITVPLIGDPAKLAFTQAVFFTDAISTLAWGAPSTAQIAGATYDVVRATSANTLPVDLYVDPATGAFKRAVFDPGGDYEQTLDVLGYGEAIPGKKIVNRWKFAGSSATHAYTKVVANGAVTGDMLHPPAQTATWTFANANPFPIKVTDTRIIVRAKANGVDGTFILDTGASGIFFTDAFAQKAHVKERGHSEASGIAGTLKIRTGTIDSLEVGGNTLSNVALSYGGGSIDSNAPDGLLGFDVLGAAFVTLDLNNSTLQFQDPSTVDTSAIKGIHVGVDLSGGSPVVPVKINGTATLNALLDSGAPGQVLIPRDFVLRNHLRMLVDNSLIGYFSAHQGMGGVSGGYEIDECGRLESVALGPIVYQNPGTCKSGSFAGNDGLVGYDFLKGFGKIWFDYPHTGMIFYPKQ
jgi:hypothetical protein